MFVIFSSYTQSVGSETLASLAPQFSFIIFLSNNIQNFIFAIVEQDTEFNFFLNIHGNNNESGQQEKITGYFL